MVGQVKEFKSVIAAKEDAIAPTSGISLLKNVVLFPFSDNVLLLFTRIFQSAVDSKDYVPCTVDS